MVNLAFRKRQSFCFAHNFKRKSIRYSILSLQAAYFFSKFLCCHSSENSFEIKYIFLSSDPSMRPEMSGFARKAVEDNLMG